MKTIISVACLLLVLGCVLTEARPKRHVLYATAPVAVAASVPVATAQVHHEPPTTVVKTEQVHDGRQSTYSYSAETRANSHVHHGVAAAPVVAAAPAAVAVAPALSTVHHTVPTYSYGYYPYSYSHYYSPYHYVVGK